MGKKIINRKKIFIPFIDGLLNLDCKKCRSACCEGGQIIMNLKEKNNLLKRYPFLRYFFVRETDKIYIIAKYLNCWFLENNGLCLIQRKYGYRTKPFVCRLHPFYIYSCKDEYVVITEGCKWLYAGRGIRNKNYSHRLILKNSQEAIENNFIYGAIKLTKKRLNLEKKILDRSRRFFKNPNYLDFAACQMALATGSFNNAKIKSELLNRVNFWKSFLKIDKLNLENENLSFELIALTPLLRLGNAYLRNMKVEEVTLALLALYFYMAIFLKSAAVKAYLTTYQEILSDISLGLLYLKKQDLNMRHKTVEEKLRYLRLLANLYKHKLMPKVKNARNSLQKI